MKGEKLLSVLTAGVLAFAVSFGAAGCLVSGFGLNLAGTAGLAAVCAGAAALGALCYQGKYGGGVVLCVLALLAGYLWREGTALTQLLALITQITAVYDRAYGCGYLDFGAKAWNADYPIAILGVLMALSVTRAVCRGKGTWMAVAGAVSPLALCFVVTDTVPDSGYLFLAMAGLILLMLTSAVRRESVPQANRLAVLAALPVVLALSGLFAAIPREGYSYYPQEIQDRILSWAEEAFQTVETTVENLSGGADVGKRETVDLASLGARLESSIAVMEVTAGEDGVLYLRGQDYDEYTGTGWVSNTDRQETFEGSGQAAGDVTIRTRHRKNILYLPYYPTGGILLTDGTAENEGGMEYTFSRTVLPEGWQELAAGFQSTSASYPFDWVPYVELPLAAHNGAQEILAKIRPEGTSNTEIAEKIGEYVRNSAEYDLDPPRMDADAEDFAVWFLGAADKGYCVHFATAAAVLLRAEGIPARYVTGYAVKARAGEAVTVTGEHAHAWVEYYEPAVDAWIVLEATPADFHAAVEETEEPSWQATYESTETPTEGETAGEATLPEKAEPTAAETLPLPTGTKEEPARAKADLSWLVKLGKWILSLLAAGLLLTAQRRLRQTLTRIACRSGEPNAQALARWREAERLAKLLKETPPEELEALARKAKFSQHTLTAEELTKFDAWQRNAIRRLRQKPWYLRVVYAYVFAAY